MNKIVITILLLAATYISWSQTAAPATMNRSQKSQYTASDDAHSIKIDSSHTVSGRRDAKALQSRLQTNSDTEGGKGTKTSNSRSAK